MGGKGAQVEGGRNREEAGLVMKERGEGKERGKGGK